MCASRDVISIFHDRLDLTLKNGIFLEMLSTYVTTPFDWCRWMIRSALVDPFFCDLERVIFSLFSCRKRLVYFQTLGETRGFHTDSIFRSKSVRVKIGPARDYNIIGFIFMLHFRVPSRWRSSMPLSCGRYIRGLLTAGKDCTSQRTCANKTQAEESRKKGTGVYLSLKAWAVWPKEKPITWKGNRLLVVLDL